MRKSILQLAAASAIGLMGAAASLTAMAQTVRIGSVVALTGPAAFIGQDEKLAQEIAVEKINANGGINGKKLELIVYDSESQTAKGLAAVRRLVFQDKVEFVVSNGGTSGIDLATGPILNAAKVPTISISGSAEIVTPVKDKAWIFKTTLDDDQAFDRVADYFKKKGITKVAVVYDTSGFGQSAADVAKRKAERYGWQVSFEPFTPTDTDLTPQLTRIRNSDAQAIIAWTATPAGVVFIKQAKQLGLGNRTLLHGFGFVSQRYLDLAGKDADGVLLVSGKFVVGEDLPANDRLKTPILELTKEFRARHKREPSFYVAQAYDSVTVAANALKAGPDSEKVRTALEKTTDLAGLGGVFNFSAVRHSGLSKDDLVIIDYANGKFRLVDYK